MGAPKGSVMNPAGRPAGIPNRSTTMAREAIARFVDDNSEKLQSWLEQIAEENPQAAFECFMKVVEYHVPKLNRTEVTGKDGDPMKMEHSMAESDKEIIQRFMKERA